MTKEQWVKILSAVFAVMIFLVIGLVVHIIDNFNEYYPDETLMLEKRVSMFFNKLTFPIKIATLSIQESESEILIPVYSVKVREVNDSWQDPRPDGRMHEGQDIFASRGTPVFSATNGYILRVGVGDIGGNFVYVIGAGGMRYYYAHLDKIAEGLYRGQEVTTDTVLGYVGNTGNAETTPPHLHFGVYKMRAAINPLPLLVNR